MKRYTFTLSFLCLFITIGAFAQTYAVPAEPTPATPNAPTTTMEFEEAEFDFGIIESGESVSYVYKFTNTGDIPLVITSAKGSCGCTVPFWPTVPIMPGESSEIEVEFNSKGKKGKQSKRVTLVANTDPSHTFLTIKGEVLPASDEQKVAEETNKRIAEENKASDEIEALHPDCFAIYPNPTNETLQLRLKEHIGKSAVVDIHNELGQRIIDKNIDQISSESTRFDVSSFKPGIYMITIRVEGLKPLTQCFVVAKR